MDPHFMRMRDFLHLESLSRSSRERYYTKIPTLSQCDGNERINRKWKASIREAMEE